MVRLFLAWLIALLVLPAAASAERRMQVSLAAESMMPRPDGEIAIALVMKPAPGWHGYWLNTGDAGTPDRIAWTLPDGTSVTPLAYPVPERLMVAGLMNYVYARPYALVGRLRIPPDLASGTRLRLSAKIDYLVCSDTLCVPENAEVTLELTAGDGAVDPADRRQFDKYRAALPKPLGSQARFQSTESGRLTLAIPLAGAGEVTQAYFYPAEQNVIDHAAAQRVGIAGDTLILELQRKAGQAAPSVLSGVVQVERPGGMLGLALKAAPGTVPPPDRWLSASAGALEFMPFLLTLLAAIAGGFILNAMPCVFPILSLKALSLARSGESESSARREALAYSAGIILSCLALGGVILLLRAGGESVGWAFQLQNPQITLALLLLMTAIGLNLAGLFNLPSLSLDHPGAPSNSTGGAFWTGVLAAFVATPCTGPFMGAALGSALILPVPAALGIFAGLGLGLALPFLLIAYIPALRARLPKPGSWMETFRRILAVPMLLTAAGLGWVLGRQAGVTGMTLGLIGAVVLTFALWWIGIRQNRGAKAGLAVLVLVLVIALPLLLGTRMMANPTPVSASSDPAFNETRLQQLRNAGKPVFVYFTADWCLTCKVNEKAAIDRTAVRDAFRRNDVEVLVGDWTNGDPAITRFLEAHDRSGVPLYLFYPKGGSEPEVLPQLLTVDMLIELGS